MKIKKIFIMSVLAAALLGCGKRQTRYFVVLPDVSGSIDRESLQQAFKAIDELAGYLQRGDKLTIIPILGDAESESSGKIMRFEVPTNRQAYDMDLRDFRKNLNISLEQMRAQATAHPGSKTDILGAISLAEQELNVQSDNSSKFLAILSDFIEEDRQLDFRNNSALSSVVPRQNFATRQAEQQHIKLKNVQIYLGLLKSGEFAALATSRRNDIKDFWIQYFKAAGALPRFFDDGPGLLTLQIP